MLYSIEVKIYQITSNKLRYITLVSMDYKNIINGG